MPVAAEPTPRRRVFADPGEAPAWGDWLLTAVTVVVMVAAVLLRSSQARYPGAERLAFTVAAAAPLVLRTRWPVGVLGATVVVETLQLLVMRDLGGDIPAAVQVAAYQPVPVASMLAAYTVALRRPQVQGWAFGAGAAVVLFTAAVVGQSSDLLATNFTMTELVLIATGIGAFQRDRRGRRARREDQVRAQTEQAVLDERLRIARELHDALAHDLTLINAQAGVAEYLVHRDAEAAGRALHDITEHTAAAIDELRATIGLLRVEAAGEPTDERAAPVAGLDRLDAMLARFRAAGADVRLETAGTPQPLAQLTDLTAYRVVQESVTNAVKHAPGAPVTVRLTWGEDELGLRVTNPPPAVRPEHVAGTGHGLIGIRERARATRGTVHLGETADGGFEVDVVLPVGPR